MCLGSFDALAWNHYRSVAKGLGPKMLFRCSSYPSKDCWQLPKRSESSAAVFQRELVWCGASNTLCVLPHPLEKDGPVPYSPL